MSKRRNRAYQVFLGGVLALSVATSVSAAGLHASRISVPSGPASIEGLGSSFAPSLASGTASYRVEIAVPPATRGFAPSLAIEYDGGSGVSEVGLGFRLAGTPSIRRRTEQGLPRFEAGDSWELTGFGPASELVELTNGYLRPRYEHGSFVRVERATDGESFEARAKGGVSYRFGGAGFTERDERGIATYLLREQVDLHGHVSVTSGKRPKGTRCSRVWCGTISGPTFGKSWCSNTKIGPTCTSCSVPAFASG